MTVSGGHARVNVSELDLSARVPGFPGVYGAITFPAKRGPLTPTLVTSESDLLKKYTPDETVEVGFDQPGEDLRVSLRVIADQPADRELGFWRAWDREFRHRHSPASSWSKPGSGLG